MENKKISDIKILVIETTIVHSINENLKFQGLI